MKPKELASAIIASSNIGLDFNSNNYYKLTIGWDSGVLECVDNDFPTAKYNLNELGKTCKL
jgi:hypothetical protein